MVLENSIDEFIERFREHAASGTLYPRIEGSPLLEFACKGRVLYLFDRCGPYGLPVGPAQVIVHPLLRGIELCEEDTPLEESLFPTGVSSVQGVGQVLEVQKGFVVVQARMPLVLGDLDGLSPKLLRGEWVRFSSEAPVHGFVLG